MRRAALLVAAALAVLARPRARGGGAHPHRARVRSARGGDRLPLPWPNDYFTRPDPAADTGRRLALPTRRCRATARACHIDRDRLRPLRRLQPRARRSSSRSRGSTRRRRSRRPARCRSRTSPATYDRDAAGRRHRRAHRPAPARSGPSSTPTPATRRRRDAAHPPRRNSPEGHRYIVALRDLRDAPAAADPAGAGVPRLPRRRSRPRPGRRARAARTWSRSSGRCAGRDRPPRPLTWPGTSPSPASARSRRDAARSATTPSPGSATRDLADRRSQGTAPPFTIDQVTDYTVRPQRAGRSRRARRGHVTVPCYLDQPGCPRAARSTSTRTACRCARPATRPGDVRLQHPALGGTPAAPGARPSLYGHGLFGSAGEVRGRATSTARRRAQRGRLRHRLDRAWPTRTSRTRSRSSRDLSRLPGAGRPPPAGLPELPVPRARADRTRRLRAPTRRSRTAGKPVIDTRRSSTTATARAASSAAR